MRAHLLHTCLKNHFFKVIGTTEQSQVAVMTLKSGGDSGPEDIHAGDQVVYVIEGEARVVINGEEGKVGAGEIVVISADSQHHIYNDGDTDLFVLNFYSSPEY